jgi:hypothetical protein
MKKEHKGETLSPQQSDSEKEMCVIGGKAMAKLIDVIADLYCTGPHRKLDALGIVALAIKRANMDVKYESDDGILNFDDLEELSDVTEVLMMDTDGLYHIVFRDGCECKHEVIAELAEEVA